MSSPPFVVLQVPHALYLRALGRWCCRRPSLQRRKVGRGEEKGAAAVEWTLGSALYSPCGYKGRLLMAVNFTL